MSAEQARSDANMRLTLIALLIALLAGCASDTPSSPTGPLDVEVVLGAGAITDVQGASIRIRFQGVTGDSRCPADAICVWAGDAVVRFDVLSGGSPFTYELHTSNKEVVRHADLTIALVQLSPYPLSSRPIPPGEYRATFRVTR